MLTFIVLILASIFILLIYRYINSKNQISLHFKGKNKSTKFALNLNKTLLLELWSDDTQEPGTSETSWRLDKATSNQIQKLMSDGYKVSKKQEITKGMASDVIGLLQPAHENDEKILNFFNIDSKNLSETSARAKALQILKMPGNLERWKSGLANDFEQYLYKLTSSEIPPNLCSQDAQAHIKENVLKLPSELAANYVEISQWWGMIDEEEERRRIGIRKPTMPDFIAASLEAIEIRSQDGSKAALEDVLLTIIKKKLRKS